MDEDYRVPALRRSLDESWANEKRLSARIVKLESAIRGYLKDDGRTLSDLVRALEGSTPSGEVNG